MEKRFELKVSDILDKQFHVDLKGYNAHEVDDFLDKVISDYQKYEEVFQILTKNATHYKEENETLRNHIRVLEQQVEANQQISNADVDQVDVLRRISRLEREVFKNK